MATADQTFDLVLTDNTGVYEIIDFLKSSKCKDAFQLDTMLMKKHLYVLVPSITHLINLSIKNCYFPGAWKQAIVTPVFKSGDRHDASNYRPISILPVLSKVTEKVAIKQLTAFLSTSNFGLHPMQFGFRPNHSTETATLHLVEQIKSQIDKGGVIGAVFLDLRRAFDTVNHNVLISKLSKFNFSSKVLEWMSSYLSDRKQCVKVDGIVLSGNITCTMGVPQGSVLGPLQMYADDTVLYMHTKTAELGARTVD